MNEEGEKLRKLFDKLKREKGISRASFAKTNGIKGGDAMIYQHISGLKPISLDAGFAYAKGLGCSLEDFSPRLARESEEIQKNAAETNGSTIIPGITIQSRRRHYPVISYVQAGAWREIVDNFEPGDAESYRLADDKYGKHTFGLVISGNSMEPEFRAGDVVFIDPDVVPNPGDYVVARNSEAEATFKKYRPRGMNEHGVPVFELVPLNEDYATMRSDHQPIQIIGTMVEHTRYRRG